MHLEWEREESRPALRKVESELLNIVIKLNVTHFRELTAVLIKARDFAWLLLPICNYMEGSCFGLVSVEIENYTSRQSSIMHYANISEEKKRNNMTWLSRITFQTKHILRIHKNSDEQSWLSCIVVMRKPQRTNPSCCTQVVNRAITNGMCSFSCLVIFRKFWSLISTAS